MGRNTKRIGAVFAIVSLMSAFGFSVAEAAWSPVGNEIMTKWGRDIDVNNVLPEYPRPQMVRSQWKNLNGLWRYAITPLNADCAKFDGEILVPFAVESALSGVGKKFTASDALWYERDFEVPADWSGRNVLLNFGAVDHSCDVWVNGEKVGSHSGGYTPFSFDITKALKSGKNVLRVKVVDPTDDPEACFQPRGKQSLKPKGCFYTAVSGIWQTVWLEPVSEKHLANVKYTADVDKSRLCVEVSAPEGCSFEVELLDGGSAVASAKGTAGAKAYLQVENPKLWSPESPYLYGTKVRLFDAGRQVDEVSGYAAMRKIGREVLVKGGNPKREKAVMTLNDKPVYNFGPLDQGWWPDGLYTAPSDEALKYDIEKTKQWGFNMIRKHIKVEPARWYYHCDRLGILVWQDMPCGKDGNIRTPWAFGRYLEKDTGEFSQKAFDAFMQEYRAMIDFLWSNPSVAVWVPFNEGWGQMNTAMVAEWTKKYDATRLVNAASGGNFIVNKGDYTDVHSYPHPRLMLVECQKVNAIGEYGGLSYVVDGHTWKSRKVWGYSNFKDTDEMLDKYCEYVDMLVDMRRYGVTAAVYTQTTDVENEANGIMTYDRAVVKFDEKRLREANRKLIETVK